MLSQTQTVDFLVIPSLARFARRLSAPAVQSAAPVKAAGLAFADIADASLQATAKNKLQVRRQIKSLIK